MQCFCRVGETGSFASAARDLDVARSVVTRTIQDLEEWTARGVLERTMHAMQLTEACDRFYTYCRRVLQDTEQTLLAMRRAPAELAGRITISPPPCRRPSSLNDVLGGLVRVPKLPECEIRVAELHMEPEASMPVQRPCPAVYLPERMRSATSNQRPPIM